MDCRLFNGIISTATILQSQILYRMIMFTGKEMALASLEVLSQQFKGEYEENCRNPVW
jgi:hypothetical protein